MSPQDVRSMDGWNNFRVARGLTSSLSSPSLIDLGPQPANMGKGSRDKSPMPPCYHFYSTWQSPGFGRPAGKTTLSQ